MIKRYLRPHEAGRSGVPIDIDRIVPFACAAEALANSALSPGSRKLLLGLLRTGATRVFPGGGVGIEYGSLLKTAVRPDDIGEHVGEVAEHLWDRGADVLLVPGMSGYPVGAMYSVVAGIPAILLKKQKLHSADDDGVSYPAGSFAIPSYTGDGDVVMSADLDAVDDIVGTVIERQLAAQSGSEHIELVIRCAGADDIIDKATMAVAITECAPLICQGAIERAIAKHLAATGDDRPISASVSVVAWVTPLIKSYNRPQELLRTRFGIEPFAGVEVTNVHLDPAAIGVESAGTFAFAGLSR